MTFFLKRLLLILLLSCGINTYSQSIVINELMSSNLQSIKDEDGDNSDWMELYNFSNSAINLLNFSLSDDISKLTKWVFPKVNLEPHQHLLIFASDKDRNKAIIDWNTIIAEGNIWKYELGNSEPPSNWNSIQYNDNDWQSGPTGIGYSDGDDSTIVASTISLYARKSFTINNLDEIEAAVLHIDYDDAFVAYLNGTEIARNNIGIAGIPPAYNQTANTAREALMYQGGKPEAYNIQGIDSLLVEGENVLAVQIHNTANSSDLSFIPFFTLAYNSKQVQSVVPQILELPKINLHTNFKISSSGETIILSDAKGNIIDSIFSGDIPTDLSRGRFPDGSNNWVLFTKPTPGFINNTAIVLGSTDPPIFSVKGGFYSQNQSISLSSISEDAQIYYTTDGSVPNQSSILYTKPISVNSTKVIRTVAIENMYAPSEVVTQSYFINLSTAMPVISLSTDPANFFDPDTGIYALGKNASSDYPYLGANFWQDWEKPIHVEFYDTNRTLGFDLDAGVRIYGSYSRGQDQKSLAIFARKEYGLKEINYPIFPGLTVKKFKSFVLRNGGNDWEYSLMRDGLMQNLLQDVDIEKQAFRSSLVFLNGEFWGIYNIREKVNEDFISSHTGYDKDSIDILEMSGDVVEGDNLNYMSMLNYIYGHDLSTDPNYNHIKNLMDIDEYINYMAAEIYFDNTDWPGNNVKFWSPKKLDGKWRWILFDTDFGFGLYDDNGYKHNTIDFATVENGPDWPNPDWSTFLFRNLLKNIEFKNKFLMRMADFMNIHFNATRVNMVIDSIKNIIGPELSKQNQRWGNRWSNYLYEVRRLKNFSENRIAYMRLYLMKYFNVDEMHTISLNVSSGQAGSIQVNQNKISAYPFTGFYFNQIPIQLTAVPKKGFRFSRWEGVNSNTNSIELTPAQNEAITAIFEPKMDYSDSIVINEINYNSSPIFNSDDWVELYNRTDSAINISNWIFKDDDDAHAFIIPEKTILNSASYIVFCNDSMLFSSSFPEVKNYLGNLGFGFSGSGELLRLFDEQLNLIDSVHYEDSTPWPNEADGNGASLELLNPNLNNDLAESWAPSTNHGTPGEKNSITTSEKEKLQYNQPLKFELQQNYPNPFNPVTTICYSIPFSETGNFQHVQLKIYDLLGNEVVRLVDKEQSAGYYSIEFKAADLASGIYFYRLSAGNFNSVRKLILLK